MSDNPATILRGVTLAGERRTLVRPVARVVQPTRPAPHAVAQTPPAAVLDRAEIDRLREAAFREGLERGQMRGLEEGREQGFKQGLAEGRQEGEAAALQQARAAQDRLEFLTERLEQWLALLPDHFQEQLAIRLKAGEDDMVALCHAVICRFLGDRAVTREAIIHAVRSAVADCAGPGSVAAMGSILAIHVHPQDLALLQSDPGLAEWLGRLRSGPIPWRPDESVGLGGCIVHSTQGSLDARLGTQLAALQDLLLSGRADSPDAPLSPATEMPR